MLRVYTGGDLNVSFTSGSVDFDNSNLTTTGNVTVGGILTSNDLTGKYTAESLGSELVDENNWTVGGGWTDGGGNHIDWVDYDQTGNEEYAYQSISITPGSIYTVTFTATVYDSQGSTYYVYLGDEGGAGEPISDGSNSFDITAGSSDTYISFGATSGMGEWGEDSLDITSISVKLIIPASLTDIEINNAVSGETSDTYLNKDGGSVKIGSGSPFTVSTAGNLTTTGDISVNGGILYMSEYFRHIGNTETYVRFTTDRLRFVAGGVNFFDGQLTTTRIDPNAFTNVNIFDNSETGENRYVRIYGFTSGYAKEYGLFQLVERGADQVFQISSNTGEIDFDNENLTTTGTGTFANLQSSTGTATNNSIAFGVGTVASGTGSFAMGGKYEGIITTEATGNYSVAMGAGVKATQSNAVAMGNYTTSSGLSSFVMGDQSAASGNYSISMGYITSAESTSAVAMGYKTTASGQGAFAMGYRHMDEAPTTLLSSGAGSVAMGYAHDGTLQATGDGSVALGYNVQATADYSFALGTSFTNNTASSFMVGFGQADLKVASGAITFPNNATLDTGSGSITTTGTGTFSGGISAGGSQLGATSIDATLSLSSGSITDATGAIDFGDENLTTTGTVNSGKIIPSYSTSTAGVDDILVNATLTDTSDATASNSTDKGFFLDFNTSV